MAVRSTTDNCTNWTKPEESCLPASLEKKECGNKVPMPETPRAYVLASSQILPND